MFVEPTLLDIEKQWESERDSFHTKEWKTSGMTPAEWAWLKYPTFWEIGNKSVPKREDNVSWWDWTIGKLSGCNMQAQVKTLLKQNVVPTEQTLTALLTATTKLKLGLSKHEQIKTIEKLATPESVSWTGKNGENPWDSGLAARDSSMFETLVAKSIKHGLHPDSIVYAKTGNTILHQAVLHDWENGIRILIENNVAVDTVNKDNLTPKMLAKEMNLKGSIRGFSVKSEPTEKPKTNRAPPQQSQMDLF